MANINLSPGSDYLMGALPSGVNQPAPTQAPALNPPSQPTMASNPSTHFSQLASPLEPGVTVQHYEFYTTITISLVHGNQEVVRKQDQHGTTKLIVMCTPLNASMDAKGYLKMYNAAPAPTRIENLAKGITKEHRPNFTAWVFDNTIPSGMGCFLMNHEQTPGPNDIKSTSLTFGLVFTSVEAKRASATTPPGGFLPTLSERDMSDKRWRIYRACHSQRDGTLQEKRCTQCQKKDSRECRKLDGVTHCTWCVQLGQTCELEKGAAKAAGRRATADSDNSGNGKNADDDDEEKPKKKWSRRSSSTNPLKNFTDDEPIMDDDEDQPKRSSSRRSSKHKLDDSEDGNDNSSAHPHSSKKLCRKSSVAAPQLEADEEAHDADDIEKLMSKKGYWRPQIESDSDNEISHRHERHKVRRTSSRPFLRDSISKTPDTSRRTTSARPALGAFKTPDSTAHEKSSRSIKKKPSASSLHRPSTSDTATLGAAKFGRLDGDEDDNDEDDDEGGIGPTGKRLRDRDAKKTYWQVGYVNGDPKQGLVKVPDMARSMSKLEYGPGRSHPGYKPVVMSDKAVTREMAGRLVGVKRKSVTKLTEAPVEKAKDYGGEKANEAEGAGGNEERPRGGGGQDDDELEKSIGEVDLSDDWA